MFAYLLLSATAGIAAPSQPSPLLVTAAVFSNEFRSVDAAGNNPQNLGTAGTTSFRKTPVSSRIVYSSPDDVDLWVGAIVEDPVKWRPNRRDLVTHH